MNSRIVLVLLAGAAAGWAQTGGGPNGRNFQPPTDQVKSYLSLTDAQIQSLQQIRQQQRQATMATMTQIADKQKSLHSMLDSGSTDAAALGQLLVDIQNLKKSISSARTSFEAQAANVLTADQKTKLTALTNAASLAPTIHQAQSLGLIAAPELPPGGMGSGRFGGRGFGQGFFRGRAARHAGPQN